MKKTLILKSLIAVLIVFMFCFAIVACKNNNQGNQGTGNEDIGNNDGGSQDGGNENDGNGGALVSKDALNAEIALEITEQGDYTAESFNNYKEKLAEAKAVANDAAATQEAVDAAFAALNEARLALILKPIEEIQGATKRFNMISGDVLEIALADYINVNGLSKITYEVKRSNAVVDISPIADGKFTVTAGKVIEATDLTVSIIVLYDGAEKLKVDLAIQITNEVEPSLIYEGIVKEFDIVSLVNKENFVIDFSENINNEGGIELGYKVIYNGEELVLDGTSYTFTFGTYTEETTFEIFTVLVSCKANGKNISLEYTYKLAIRDTAAYSVVNGNFENGLEGWTIITDLGETPFGDISDRNTFWNEGYPMFNAGKYFSAYIGEENYEPAQGTLASSYFIVNSDYATYMLGGANNHNVYITIENKNGEVLALYRNTHFCDFPAGEFTVEERREMIGSSVFLANFVTYKIDLSEFAGQEVRFVIHDHASEGWGLVFFDELITYYVSVDELPENAVLAENLLANKAALNAELALEITEQGDYTADSYNAYVAKLDAAKALLGDVAVAQADVDRAVAALTEARLALAVRPVEEVQGANKSFTIISGNNKEIVIADYINVNNLSNITYELIVGDYVTVSNIVDGRFTVTSGVVSQATETNVIINVLHNGVEKLSVELTVQITNDLAPTIFEEEFYKRFDLYYLENKENVLIDVSENVDNPGNLELTYTINRVIEGPTFTFAFGDDYTDADHDVLYNVVVSYVANGKEQSISYTYVVSVKDTTDYRIENGGFENGLDGWTVVGNIGNISSDTHYWVNDPEVPEGFEFGMDGNNMFSAYAPGAYESAVGTLTSPTFKVGGNCVATFKLGAGKDANYVYVDVVDANTKEILARYYNGLWAERTDGVKSGCTLIPYAINLADFDGKEVFLRFSDNADSGYGLFFLDSVVTYYTSWPQGFNDAIAVDYQLPGTVYDVFNGGFEMGDVQGWWNHGEIGVVTNANGYWGDNIPYEKVGDYLFTGVESFGADTMREGNRGSLTSSVFEIGGTGYISFKLGGGGSALCYIQVIDAVTGEVLARYHQQEQRDAILIQYVADLSDYIGRTVRIQVVDQADSGWGCVSFDNLVTYYASTDDLPEGFTANDIKDNRVHTIVNGSFEDGLDGWTMNITEAGAHNTLGWVLETEIDAGWYTKNDDIKDGRFLFTFAQPGDINCENSKGTLQSSTFSLKQGAFVSFKFGGAGGAQNHDVYIELCRADGSVIARFYNDAPGKVNTRMNAYYYQYNGVEVDCFFRVVDNSTGDYGCFVVDDFRVNLESAPDGYIAAIQ